MLCNSVQCWFEAVCFQLTPIAQAIGYWPSLILSGVNITGGPTLSRQAAFDVSAARHAVPTALAESVVV